MAEKRVAARANLSYTAETRPCPVEVHGIQCSGTRLVVVARTPEGVEVPEASTGPLHCGGHPTTYAPPSRMGSYQAQR